MWIPMKTNEIRLAMETANNITWKKRKKKKKEERKKKERKKKEERKKERKKEITGFVWHECE